MTNSPYFAAVEAERLRYALEQHDAQIRKLVKRGVDLDRLQKVFQYRAEIQRRADQADQLSRPRGPIQFTR